MSAIAGLDATALRPQNGSPDMIDARLDQVALKQLVWKPGPMRDVARCICEKALHEPFSLWPDMVDTTALLANGDRNTIGTCWRLLTRFGILERTTEFRRSTAPDARGHTIFKYRLRSEARARTFLARNGFTAPPGQQGELF